MDEPNIPLPKAPIIGYVSNITTPTRVRAVAARWVFWIGIFLIVLSAVLFYLLATDFLESYAHRWGAGPGTLNGLKYILRHRPEYFFYFFLLLIFLFTPALALVGFAAAIRRGRRAPSIIATISLLPFSLGVMLATAIFVSMIFLDIFNTRSHLRLGLAPWLLLTPIPVLVVLLIKDLCEFLVWIARNPITEKPPTPFLPTASRSG